MRIVLAYPPDDFTVRPGQQVGLGLLYIAAVAERAGHTVAIMQEGPDYEPRLRAMLAGADILGFTATCLDLPTVCELAERLDFPGWKIIGGPGTTTYPEFLEPYLARGVIHSVMIGEGEEAFLHFLADVAQGRPRPAYRAARPVDINALPFPARHLVQRHGHGLFLDDEEGSAGTIVASRGCPFDCHFCAAKMMWGRRVRMRHPEDFKRELYELIDTYHIKQLRLSDDNIISEREYARQIFTILGEAGVPWRVSIRVKPNDPELYQMMRDTGCHEVSFGIESFDPHVLKVLNKAATAEDNKRAIQNARAAGLIVRALMIIGSPGETEQTVDLNLAALAEARPTTVSCKTFVPLPGCAVWRDPAKFGVRIVNRDMREYNFWMYTRYGTRPVLALILPDGWTEERYVAHVLRMRAGLEEMGLAHKG